MDNGSNGSGVDSARAVIDAQRLIATDLGVDADTWNDAVKARAAVKLKPGMSDVDKASAYAAAARAETMRCKILAMSKAAAPVIASAPAAAPVATVAATAPAPTPAPAVDAAPAYEAPAEAPVREPDPRLLNLCPAYAGRRAGDLLRLEDGRLVTLHGWRDVSGAMMAVVADCDSNVLLIGKLGMGRATNLLGRPSRAGFSAKGGDTRKPETMAGGVPVKPETPLPTL